MFEVALLRESSEANHFIEGSCCCQEQINDKLQKMIDMVVTPCLSINVIDSNPELQHLANQLAASLACRNLGEMGNISARLAEACCRGTFQQRPAIMGVMVQCLDLIDREERGVLTLKRPKNMGEQEQELLHEASALLALNGSSDTLMRSFGFNKKQVLRVQGRVENLLSDGLPCGPLALIFPEVIQRNATLIDSLSPRPEGLSPRRFNMCFDFTYVMKQRSQMSLHGKQGVVGGPFAMSDIKAAVPGSFQWINDGKLDLVEQTKANRMLLGLFLYAMLFPNSWTPCGWW